MKRKWQSALILLVVFALAGTVHANTITLSDPGSRYSNGGPFTADVTKTTPDALVGDPFTTFCIELAETINFNTTYHYSIASYAYGQGNQTSDPLDPRSAWLYYSFRTDTTFADTVDEVKALQAAFWHIEGEQSLPASPVLGSVQDLAWGYVNLSTGKWSDIGPVVVLNLYTTNSAGAIVQQNQSVLGLTAVPEPASILLLGLGLAGLGFSSRKLRK